MLGFFKKRQAPKEAATKQQSKKVTFPLNDSAATSQKGETKTDSLTKRKKAAEQSGSNKGVVYLLMVTIILSLLFYVLGNSNGELGFELPDFSLSLPDSTYHYEFD